MTFCERYGSHVRWPGGDPDRCWSCKRTWEEIKKQAEREDPK